MTQDSPDLAEENFELFTGAIDEAIDKLFTPLVDENIKSQSEPVASPHIPEPEKSPQTPSPAATQQNPRFNKAEEALMSLEWDITPNNIKNFQETLLEIQEVVTEKYELKEIFHLTSEVLTVLKKSPQNAPISGPKALKDTLRFLRTIDESSDIPGDTATKITTIINELQAALPKATQTDPPQQNSQPPDTSNHATTLKTLSPPVFDTELSTCTAISAGLYSALEYHISVIENNIRLIIPVEKLFNKTKGYEQFHAILSKVRLQLSKQLNYYQNALASDYQPSKDTTNIKPPDVLFYALQSHISLLIQCEKRVIAAENVFKKAVGMEKLYAIHRRLREQLGKQHSFLERVSNGQYRVVTLQDSENISTENLTPPVCPWKNLTVCDWKGEQTAFIPEQIAFAGEVAWWAKTKLKHLSILPLRLLKSWPWTAIKPKLKGNLQEYQEKQLTDTRIPILQKPQPYINDRYHSKNDEVLILHDNKNSAAAFVNSTVENLEVSKEDLWEECLHKNSIIAGYLTINNQVIPVVSLENLK